MSVLSIVRSLSLFFSPFKAGDRLYGSTENLSKVKAERKEKRLVLLRVLSVDDDKKQISIEYCIRSSGGERSGVTHLDKKVFNKLYTTVKIHYSPV